MSQDLEVTAFAPASIGNLAVGFDCLGMALQGVGDHVTIYLNEKDKAPLVTIDEIQGIEAELPLSADKNTAGKALLTMMESCNFKTPIGVLIKKGIPLSSGMGGSAASAVAAVRALSYLMIKMNFEVAPSRVSDRALFHYALSGEVLASGSYHGDNVAPSLYGGLTLVGLKDVKDFENGAQIITLPGLSELYYVLVHPHIEIETAKARAHLAQIVTLKNFVGSITNMGMFMAALYKQDHNLLKSFMEDVVIEPQRKEMIPGFDGMKKMALDSGALCFSISGGGPSVFAWTYGQIQAQKLKKQLVEAFNEHNLVAEGYVGTLTAPGAHEVNH